MTVNTKNLVSITEANQNFSKVARMVDENGTVIILKNNVPRYMIVEFRQAEEEAIANDEDVALLSARLIAKNRAAYEELLEAVAAACCQDVLFASDQANRLTKCILERFQVAPDFPWEKETRYQSYGTFRHASNRKWFALIMHVKRAVLDKDDNPDPVDIINLKIQPEQGEALRQLPSVYPAYHINHKTWISVVLDDTHPDAAIMKWIDESYRLTQ